jgi:hypothetical protein
MGREWNSTLDDEIGLAKLIVTGAKPQASRNGAA